MSAKCVSPNLVMSDIPTFTNGTRSWTLAKGDLVSDLPGFLAHPLIDRGMLMAWRCEPPAPKRSSPGMLALRGFGLAFDSLLCDLQLREIKR